MVTMQDVADLAGVSQSTVSHYVNGTRPVHPDTRRSIQEAIDETGYVHDAVARSLRTGRSHTVGIAITAISNPYFGALVRRITSRLEDTGRTVLLVDTRDDVERELEAIRQLLQHRPEAVLLAPAGPTSTALDLLVDRKVPTVLVDRIPDAVPDHVDAVGVNNREPMQELVDHLGALGHRSIALLAGMPGIPTTDERVEGYRQGMARLGPTATSRVAHASLEHDETAAAMDELFGTDPRPTALIGGNNQATIAAMQWLRRHDLAVPQDISVASFDDFEWSDVFHPRLTAISQPIEDIANTAASLLEDRLAEPTRPSRVVRLSPKLIVRDSAVPAD